MNMRPFGSLGCRLTAAAALALCTSAHAQEQPPAEPVATPAPTPARPLPTRPQKEPDIRAMAADGLARMSLIILRDIPAPGADDYRISALGLRMAQTMRPDGIDEELMRLEREAWKAAGDHEEVLELTRKLVRIAPNDSVALLTVLASRIQALQDIDQRVAAYDRLLGSEGQAIDPAIRSRLALDAALLLRENGDEAGFVRRLTDATTLDVTNKDAAVLYATYFLDRTTNARERADLLGNIILAGPTDVSAYNNLAIELFRKCAFRGASRFYDCATNLILAAGDQLSVDDVFDRMLVTWLAEGPAACEKQLQAMLDERLASVVSMRNQMKASGLDPGPEPEIRLPTRFEMLRLAMAFAAGNREQLEKSIQSMAAVVAEQSEMIDEREAPFDKLTEEQAASTKQQFRLELIFARLWAGVQTEEAQADLKAMLEAEDAIDIGPTATERFNAMIAVRSGNVEEGLSRLNALADRDLASAIGAAIALEVAGRRDEAIRAYARIALHQANSAIGAAARGRLETLVGQPLAPTPDAVALDKWAAEFAPWLNSISEGPRRFMSLKARHIDAQISLFDRIQVEITLRNASRWPLALGPEATMSSRIMLTPRVTVLGKDTQEMVMPEVLDIARKLRLSPGEEISVQVWADRGSVGTLAQLTATRATRIRWRLLQGYRMDAERQFLPGALSLSCETDLVSIDSFADLTDEEMIEAIRSAQGRPFYEALLIAQGSGARRKPGESPQQNLERRTAYAEALASNIEERAEYDRLWALTVALPGGLFHAGHALVDAVRNDPSPLVKAALLIGPYRSVEVTDPPDLSHDEDPLVARMGKLVNEFRARRDAAAAAQQN